jgi:hypothetical protein
VVPRSQSAVVGGPLAVNKQGIIRGNLHDRLTDSVVELAGSVDKETQRTQGNEHEVPRLEQETHGISTVEARKTHSIRRIAAEINAKDRVTRVS